VDFDFTTNTLHLYAYDAKTEVRPFIHYIYRKTYHLYIDISLYLSIYHWNICWSLTLSFSPQESIQSTQTVVQMCFRWMQIWTFKILTFVSKWMNADGEHGDWGSSESSDRCAPIEEPWIAYATRPGTFKLFKFRTWNLVYVKMPKILYTIHESNIDK
jgi:hypothetical protein